PGSERPVRRRAPSGPEGGRGRDAELAGTVRHGSELRWLRESGDSDGPDALAFGDALAGGRAARADPRGTGGSGRPDRGFGAGARAVAGCRRGGPMTRCHSERSTEGAEAR